MAKDSTTSVYSIIVEEFQPLSAISDLQQSSSPVFESMEKEVMALTTIPSQAAAPPSKNEPECGCGGGAWSPLFDGILNSDEEEIMNVDERINIVLYGAVESRGRLPVFEEISPSFDFDELMKMQMEIFQFDFTTEDNNGEEF